ncbi:MAG: glycine--tRNA ligase subunit beta [Ferrovum sp.]|jgi:glycyl-tRNA synthetase beta chain|nr:glycine--tRNA ligase subunit beta [Ferrovum sp.]
MTSAPLLIELRTEELPPKSLLKLSTSFAQAVHQGLVAQHLAPTSTSVRIFATPRRLAVLIEDVNGAQPERQVERKGPSHKAGRASDGTATPALQGFARSCGIAVDELELRTDDKGLGYYVHRSLQRGIPLGEVLPALLEQAVRQLPVAKVMRWGSGNAEFVRPVHGLMVLHGDQLVPLSLLGLSSSRQTLGHRFLGEGLLTLDHASAYAELLEREGKVIASFAERRQRIQQALDTLAQPHHVLAGPELLDEVTALVEWPTVLEGRFDPAFLEIPQECLILSMQQHQKYFPLGDAQNQLQPRFLLVSNLETATPMAIVRGNERVLHARLADARFFYQQDLKIPLSERRARLDQVVYHQRLGSLGARVERLSQLAEQIAHALHLSGAQARRAAQLLKADLVTDMVGEFPELQGFMGRDYARHDQEAEEVALAIEAHYRPRFAGDTLPTTPLGTVMALADKLETLVGIYGIGQIPTGDRDPYGLRRATLGILRLLMDKAPALELPVLLAWTEATFPRGVLDAAALDSLPTFIQDRLRGLLRDQGFDQGLVEAVISPLPARLDQLPAHLQALATFRTRPEAIGLSAAHKRIRNLLKKSGSTQSVLPAPLQEPAELDLQEELRRLQPRIATFVLQADFSAALSALAELHAPVDRFFTDLMVMCEDPGLRAARLALLQNLESLMNQVGDLSCLSG